MYELIRITTQEQATAEGAEMHHAVGVLFNILTGEGVEVYSLRHNGNRVLTISVRKDVYGDAYCEHVVGKHGRAPTESEIMTLSSLLLHYKVELRYDPETIC